MRNIATKVDNVGDTLSAGEFNSGQNELENMVTTTGQSLDPGAGPDADLNMLGKAAGIYGAGGGNFYTDSGAANAYVLSKVGSFVNVPAYFEGMDIVFEVGNTNTGASTVNVSSLGVKNLTTPWGTALADSTLIAGSYAWFKYRSVAGRFELVNVNNQIPVYSRTFFDRATFGYKDADEVYISAGAYHHYGTTGGEQIVHWDGLEFQLLTLAASTWSYLYIDDSTLTPGVPLLTASNLVDSTTAPTYVSSSGQFGWYNGQDRCIAAFYGTGTNVQQEFYGVDNLINFSDSLGGGTSTIGTSWVAKTLVLPAFCTKAKVRFSCTDASGSGGFWYRPTGSAATTGEVVGSTSAAAPTSSGSQNTITLFTNTSQQMDVKAGSATGSLGYATHGYYFGNGI